MKFSAVLPKPLRFFIIVAVTASLIVSVGLGLRAQIDFSDLAAQNVSSSSNSPGLPPVFPVQASLPSPASVVQKPAPIPSVSPISLPIIVQPKSSYGHLPYQEDDPTRLQTVGLFVRNNSARRESMDIEAVQAFREMSIAAKASGVSLMPISGFRTIAVQTALFAQQVQRRGSKKAAAKWSAPPGYSEHHTGYAIDIADQRYPRTDLQISFEGTPAYRWLVANAASYGFELSFPQNNWQGIGYEPWHWRYVGSARAGQTFAAARGYE